MLEHVRQVHFVGIGGAGMAPLAQVLLETGISVQGSDLHQSAATARLAAAGARIFIGHAGLQIEGADLVVISSAIPANNPEIVAARERHVAVVKRAELWGELMLRQRTIAVAGTHGKTTTSAMVATILRHAGLDPTMLIGGDLIDLGTGAKRGAGEYLVAEADEFDGSFLRFAPWIAVVTNVEADHLDYYGNFEAIVAAFHQFVDLLPIDGCAVLCWDDPQLRRFALADGVHRASYGFAADAEWRAYDVVANDVGGNDFMVSSGQRDLGRFRLRLPGRHNVSNALAAVTVAGILDIPSDVAREAIANFAGTRRRLELRGTAWGVTVYDDYAHHPTEIRATLAAVRERHGGRLFVVFQPHTYHRTKQLLPEFAEAFGLADRVVITDIYLPPGREADTLGISAQHLVAAMRHDGSCYAGTLHAAAAILKEEARPGDWVLTMGAGDVHLVADDLLDSLASRDM
jgi:UDP-N-acetylmuramate--alanine ligase